MHASSYQRDIASAQQVAKENGALEDCTHVLILLRQIGCLTVLLATITTRPMGKKTWQKETESSVPKMVGNLVCGVSPVQLHSLLGDETSTLCLLKKVWI
ncbi:unnamed protein product [Brassica oleracea var. botrytis]